MRCRVAFSGATLASAMASARSSSRAFAPGQVAPRDAAITASGLDCP